MELVFRSIAVSIMKSINKIAFISLLICLYPSVNYAASLVIAPDEYSNMDGNTENFSPFFSIGQTTRYQQVFSSSEFSTLTNPAYITAISFRLDSNSGGAFSFDISDIKIALSTTNASPDALDYTFENNIGADTVMVYDGSLNLSSTSIAGPGNTYAFDIAINLMTPFLYNPTNGNLLLDVKNYSTDDSLVTFFDATEVNSDSISRVWASNADASIALGGDSTGLIAQFTVSAVPIPASAWLFGSGLLGLIGVVRRKK